MRIEIKTPAMKTLKSIANWVETKNTEGSGSRYMNKFYDFIYEQAESIHSLPLCKFPEFNIRKLTCLFYNDWVVAVKPEKSKIVIHIIIHGSWLNY